MDDYYELLGVDADAPPEDIRSAYRERKSALADKPEAKSEVAALNKAWNVLSDPYQRGRYDQQREETAASDGGDDRDTGDDGDDGREPASSRSRTPARTRAQTRGGAARGARVPLTPTVTLPAGTVFAPPRKRVVAMLIDLFILFLLFVGSLTLTVSLEKSSHRVAYDRMTKLQNTLVPDAQKAQSNAAKTASNVAKAKGASSPDAKAAAATATDAQNKLNALNKDLDKQRSILAPIQNSVTGGYILLSMLILVVPGIFWSGQTIGKRLQGIRVIRVDGSRLRIGDAIRRYGALVLAAYALSLLLSLLGPALVLFGATMWMRNPNRQALQDKLAKTLVVADAA